MRLKTLGGLTLETGEFSRPKPLLLLAYLSVEGTKEKRHLHELFWPEAANPANSLRVVSKLIRDFDPDLLRGDERTLSSALESDIAALQTALGNADAEEAARLYQGSFLAEFSLPDWGAELEEWVYSTREFIAGRVRASLIRAAETEAATGAFAGAARWAERAYQLTQEAPEAEDLERLYPLLVAGDSTLVQEALKRAREYGLELNLSPEEARRRYFVAAREGAFEARTVPNNLPRAKTSFIGRDPELIEVGQRMSQGEARLITLLGPGGIGKTRLSLELAAGQLREASFPDGVYFVALDALTDPAQIPLAIAQAISIKVKDDPLAAVQAGIANKRMLLVLDNFEHLMDGALQVSELLETCPNVSVLVTSRERLNLEEEHALLVQGLPVPKEARFAEAEYLDAIKLFLQRAKRARLDFELTPQNLPSVLDICQLVEGSPLGIELAAVWLRSLPIFEIAREIGQNLELLATSSRNIAQRHQSLRAVFEHSWKLLRPKEQQTLARLTVFADGFRREAAGQVGDATIPLLTSLVDKSLLRINPEGRYDFHPLLYQYAAEKLADTPEEKEQIRARHSHSVLTLIEASQKAEAQAHIRCCNDEHQNVLTALAWSQQRDQVTLGLRLANAFAPFWENQGYVSEGRQWIATLLAQPGAAAPTEERARALLSAGRMASRQSDRAGAVTYGNEALALCQALGLDAVSIRVFVLLANEASLQGDVEGGKKHAEAGLVLARKLGDDELVAATLVMLGSLAEWLGRLEEAWALFEESLSLLRKLDRRKSPEYPLNLSNLGYIAWLRGDLKTAKAHLEEAMDVARNMDNLFLAFMAQDNLSVVMLDLGDLASSSALGCQVLEYRHAQNDRWGLAFSFENFACLALEQQAALRAARLWGVAERLREEIQAPMVASWQARQERFKVRANSQIGEASFRAASQEGRSMGLEEAVNYAFDATRSPDLQFAEASLPTAP